MELTEKQTIALDYLEDDVTTEVYYGGAAGGGKSKLGCYWLTKMGFKYPGSRWLMGRSELKNLKKTTLNTFFETAKEQGLRAGTHYDLNSQESIIHFPNLSQIILADLHFYPSDPDFDSLGSLEITGAFIDETPQVTEKGKNIVKSRIRYKLNEFGLIPKLLMTGNPAKNWSYNDFYKPFKEGTLRKDRKFVQALPGDNPHLPASYIESLRGLDKNSRERLLEGNWEYDDDPSALISYEKILDCFTNDFDSLAGEGFITGDIARLGSDKVVLGDWNGFRLEDIKHFSKQRLNNTLDDLEGVRRRKAIPKSNVIIDEDGVGGGIMDFGGYKGFVNNSRPLPNPLTREDENYASLKDQCSFRMADRIQKGGLYIHCPDITVRNMIIEEMECVKQWNMDKDGKKKVMPKEEVKKILGRSPDFWDMIMMREWFALRAQRSWAIV